MSDESSPEPDVDAPPEASVVAAPERVPFSEWRRTRPFTAAVLLVVGGVAVLWPPLRDIAGFGPTSASVSGTLVGLGIATVGLLALVRPRHATALGAVALVLASASLPLALGGYLIGMLVSATGGILCFAWSPPEEGPDGAVGAD